MLPVFQVNRNKSENILRIEASSDEKLKLPRCTSFNVSSSFHRFKKIEHLDDMAPYFFFWKNSVYNFSQNPNVELKREGGNNKILTEKKKDYFESQSGNVLNFP